MSRPITPTTVSTIDDLLRVLAFETSHPQLNLEDGPAVPSWTQAQAQKLRSAAARIDLSWDIYRMNQGA